jgi:RimJ/RimL family protein N-acetyltransferase
MTAINISLYEGEHICLGPIDFEKDPPVISGWTHRADYLRALSTSPAKPLSSAQVKKRYEALEKQMEESKNLFHFTIRSREDDRLLGFAKIQWIEWSHGNGFFQMAIGDPQDRGSGYGTQALQLILRFAFDELNLYRLTVQVGDDNSGAIRFFKRAGFVEEVRRRKVLHRDGQFYDMLHLGLLNEEYQASEPTDSV